MAYYVDGSDKIQLTPSSRHVAISYTPGPPLQTLLKALTSSKSAGATRPVISLPNEKQLLPLERGESKQALLDALKTKGISLGPEVFETADGSLLLPDGKVNADLSGKDEREVAHLLKQVHATIEEGPSADFPFHVLKAQHGDAFLLANTLAEEKKLLAQPRFLKLLKQPQLSAPFRADSPAVPLPLSRQWGLQAIRATQAWNITRGGPAVKVAIIDSGVDLEHPDLRDNLLSGYDDYEQDDEPQPHLNSSNAHGTACAGIVAAAGKHALGVAPGCKLIPIRLGVITRGHLLLKPGAMVRCINQAVKLGAWIISNSYSELAPDGTVRKTLQDAIRQGRHGLGCVVVASSGDEDGTVKYPANYEDVIAVAAVDKDGNRWTDNTRGSGFGPHISVAAPGTEVWTTDTQERGGYSAEPFPLGNYTATFDGPSAACPFVAGVAALVLSIHPKLTASEVRDILKRTADKTGHHAYPGGRNDFLGHGRVNALAAVQEAKRRLPGGAS
jgi:subtilisin family serine protease